ncbi:MAG TPA: hypothetical protein VMI75_22765 [Polyangiaceae bacterium]|nr:hypothetical protein [Polyangiaceae bacterium]
MDTKHSDIDAAAMAKRAATLQVEQRHELDSEVKPLLMVLDARTQRIEQTLGVIVDALRPRMSPQLQAVVTGAIVVASVALVVIAFAVVSVARAPAASAATRVETR